MIGICVTTVETRRQEKSLRNIVSMHSCVHVVRDHRCGAARSRVRPDVAGGSSDAAARLLPASLASLCAPPSSAYRCDGTSCRRSTLETDSADLVPGDVIALNVRESGEQMVACDAVLVSGQCIVNESMLTGESAPVAKVALTAHGSESGHDADADGDTAAGTKPPTDATCVLAQKRNTLFAGTSVIQARSEHGHKHALAVVVRTGFGTSKGCLVRSILYPRDTGRFRFYRDSIRFILLLAAFALIGFGVALWFFLRLHVTTYQVVVRSLDLFTIVVPPALPVAMTIGTVFAMYRLKRRQVFCISPPRVNVCGKLKIICFDKTGTLTEDSLDVHGVQLTRAGAAVSGDTDAPPLGDSGGLGELLDETALSRLPPCAAIRTLAACHSLATVHHGGLIGDPLDVKMFVATKWRLSETPHSDPATDAATQAAQSPRKSGPVAVVRGPSGTVSESVQLDILRQLHFTSESQRAGVVVLHHRAGTDAAGRLEYYTKGAPEVVQTLCDPSTIPADYAQQLHRHASRGYRVLAMAGRVLSDVHLGDVRSCKRAQLESRLSMYGLLVMRNCVKPATTPVIRELNGALARAIMITGDSALTAVSVARECAMIDPHSRVFFGDVAEAGAGTDGPACNASGPPAVCVSAAPCDHLAISAAAPLSVLQPVHGSWTLRGQLHRVRVAVHPAPPDGTTGVQWRCEDNREPGWCLDGHTLLPYCAHGTGTAAPYALCITGAAAEQLRKRDPAAYERLLVTGTVFARMRPNDKARLVEDLQGIGYVAAMVGDGANDCGALKAALVGVSLSEAEASVAAPFTYKRSTIECVPYLIREGRGALMTSFALFKFMALYSLIQFTSVILLYYFDSNLADQQFLYIDLFIVLVLAVLMGRTEPSAILSARRPPGSLVSALVLSSMLLQLVTCVAFQGGSYGWLAAQPWYVPLVPNPDDINIASQENTVLFTISMFQYLAVCVSFSFSRGFRKQWWTNVLFTLALIVITVLSVTLLFFDITPVRNLFSLVPLPGSARAILAVISAACACVLWIFELVLVPRCAQLHKWAKRQRAHYRPKNRYKQILAEMDYEAARNMDLASQSEL